MVARLSLNLWTQLLQNTYVVQTYGGLAPRVALIAQVCLSHPGWLHGQKQTHHQDVCHVDALH